MSDSNLNVKNSILKYINSLFSILIIFFVFFYMSTFQLGYNKCAVLTSFGKAIKGYKNDDGVDSGLKWKWPWPVQRVFFYDSRIQTLSDRLEQQETRDRHVVILNMYMTWRISNPVDFYKTFSKIKSAQFFLRDRLSSARWIIGQFTFDDLTNVDESKLKISDAEIAIFNQLQKELEEYSFGIEISHVGIKRILLPESITQAIFGRMRVTRQRLAQNARSEGDAIAQSIRAQANSDQKRILSFAERIAQDIRSQGDEAAAKYYHIFKKDEDFAIYIRNLESLQTMLKENTTLVLDTETAPFNILKQGLTLEQNDN